MININQNTNLHQSQQLVMTPQLQQAIKLLQLSNIELAGFIEDELEKNPLLEKDKREASDTEEHTDANTTETIEGPKDEVQAEFDDAITGNDAQSSSTTEFDASTSQEKIGPGGNTNFENIENSFENTMSRPETLREHLIDQLMLSFSDPRDHLIGNLLIDQLDETGYLRTEASQLAERLGCSPERIDHLLEKMRDFGPTGIFAHDLADCLALQLEEKNTLDEPMKILLTNLDMLADHDLKGLAKKCGVNDTYLTDMIEEIRSLNPKPAGEFDHLVVQTAIPDVFMKRLPKSLGGGWRVELNSDTLPKVLVNQSYYTEISDRAKNKDDKTYLNEQLQSASWLVKAMDQRAKTILKVAAEIIEQQDAFFNYGIEFLKPLTLKNIAEEIEMHESTVSRVTTNKYIGTPRGTFELKYFFSTALISEDGSAHSSQSIKARIQTLIDSELPQKILSDDKIVVLLKDKGIDIARRTVAKYRKALHIPSSVQRRKQKANQIPQEKP